MTTTILSFARHVTNQGNSDRYDCHYLKTAYGNPYSKLPTWINTAQLARHLKMSVSECKKTMKQLELSPPKGLAVEYNRVDSKTIEKVMSIRNQAPEHYRVTTTCIAAFKQAANQQNSSSDHLIKVTFEWHREKICQLLSEKNIPLASLNEVYLQSLIERFSSQGKTLLFQQDSEFFHMDAQFNQMLALTLLLLKEQDALHVGRSIFENLEKKIPKNSILLKNLESSPFFPVLMEHRLTQKIIPATPTKPVFNMGRF